MSHLHKYAYRIFSPMSRLRNGSGSQKSKNESLRHGRDSYRVILMLKETVSEKTVNRMDIGTLDG